MIAPKIYGLIGYPVKHSLSLAMQNAAFAYLKKVNPEFHAEYRLFEIKPQDLEDFLLKDVPVEDIYGQTAFTHEIMGFNVTIPHKIKAREILETRFAFPSGNAYMSQEDLYYVKLSGAINTVKRNQQRLECRNTDAPGFLESLKKDLGFDPQGKNALVIGCGGAGRAIAAALSWVNVGAKKIYITDIRQGAMDSAREHFRQFAHLRGRLEFISREHIPLIIKDCQLLINASPLGMQPEDPPVLDSDLLSKGLYVYDVIYNRQTSLVKDAKNLGLPATDGLGMLLYQGVRSFEFWMGLEAPVEIMRKALREAVYR